MFYCVVPQSGLLDLPPLSSPPLALLDCTMEQQMEGGVRMGVLEEERCVTWAKLCYLLTSNDIWRV